MKHMILFLALVISLPLWSAPEKELPYLWQQEIMPYFHQLSGDYFINQKGQKINYYSKTHPDNKKVLVIIPGRTESSMKYAELLYDLKDKGFDFFIIDHQGQGFSERVLKDPHKGYVRRFQHYVDDMTLWMNEVVQPQAHNKELYLLAHSMGGAIASLYMAQNPELFKRAVLSAPMFQINTTPYTEKVARLFSQLLITLRKATSFTPGWGPYIAEEDTFENNTNTHSLARFESSRSIYQDYPQTLVHAPTVRWTNEALKATQLIHLKATKIKTALLLFQAGADQTVMPTRQHQFCQTAPHCRISFFPESFHEPFMEIDEIRNRAIQELLQHFSH